VQSPVVVSLSDSDYPSRLVTMPGAPTRLYRRGPLPSADIAVAVVGARAARGHSVALARSVAADLASAGAVVVSGGAIGVDSAAHQGALDAGGKTVAVLAGGLEAPYPERNRPLFGEIVRRGGALLSVQPPGMPPLRGTLARRNEVIAAMVDAVIVIEAQAASGSLQTAAAATRFGRVLGAAPGSPGCEALLARGAALVENAADVLAALRGEPRRPIAQLPEAGSREAAALAALDTLAPRSGAAIAERCGMDLREVTRALTGLELEGLALLQPGQTYVRSPLAEQLMQG
jgi:DNA processing protein